MTDLVRAPVAVLETAQAAAAAASRAAIQTRYELALMRPRNLDAVRVALLKECERPTFAQAAIYKKPIGRRWNDTTGAWEDGYLEGLSIRFAEAARRCYGNTYDEATIVFEDGDKVICRVTAMDLETNSTTSVDVRIEKTVERREPKQGQEIVAERMNSRGQKVFVVRANDDEIRGNIKREIPKELREALLSLIPGDLLVECEALCRETRAREDARDPDKARRDLIDAFDGVGVPPAELAAYVGHALDHLNPAELEDLRAIFAALRDGEARWKQFAEDRGRVDAKGQPTPAARKVDAVLEKAKKNLARAANKHVRDAGDTGQGKPGDSTSAEPRAPATPGTSEPVSPAPIPASQPTHDVAAGEVAPEHEPKG